MAGKYDKILGKYRENDAGSADATSLQGSNIDSTVGSPSDGDIIVYRDAGSDWVLEAKPAGGSNPALNDVTDVSITSVADNEVLAYDSGGNWINQTAAEAGLASASHTHATSDITSGTLADALVAESNVTQHEAALSITESQISDLGTYVDVAGDTMTGGLDITGTAPLLNVNGSDPDATSESVMNLELSWDKKMILWGDRTNGNYTNEGYTRIEFRPKRRTGVNTSDVQMLTHDVNHDSGLTHEHFSFYSSNAAGTPTKRFDIDYAQDVAEFHMQNMEVLLDDPGAAYANGYQMRVYTNTAQTNSTTANFEVISDNASSTQKVARFVNDGTGNTLLLDQNGNGIALNIDTEATSADTINLDAVNTSGTVIDLNLAPGVASTATLLDLSVDSNVTGPMINLTSAHDEAVLLKFNIDRAWQWEQEGTGAGTSLILRSTTGDKQMYFEDSNNTWFAKWSANVASTSNASLTLRPATAVPALELDQSTGADAHIRFNGDSGNATPTEGDMWREAGALNYYDGATERNLLRKEVQIAVVDFTTDVSTGDGKFYFHVGPSLAGMDLVDVHAEVITAGTTGTTDIQIHNVTQAADMLSTKLTIDTGETGSDTAATAAVVDTANDDVAQNDLLRIDVDAVSTTAPKGLIVTLGFTAP